ncbi:hypothetical protein Droror1_Dr00015912 [Drosera rotundifolia]
MIIGSIGVAGNGICCVEVCLLSYWSCSSSISSGGLLDGNGRKTVGKNKKPVSENDGVHFQFVQPFLQNAELGDLIRFLYKGTLRVLLVLLHDFPKFLCDYHFSFCDVIPASCIQMRNIILSAFPRNMRLPDPSTPNLKIDLLQEMAQPPRILSEVDATLKAKHMKADVDEYLKTQQQGSSFPNDLKQRLLLLPNSDFSHHSSTIRPWRGDSIGNTSGGEKEAQPGGKIREEGRIATSKRTAKGVFFSDFVRNREEHSQEFRRTAKNKEDSEEQREKKHSRQRKEPTSSRHPWLS